MQVSIRLLAASEWPLWRDLSLQSLTDSPDAFRPTLAESSDRPDAFWRELVGSTVGDERCSLLIADDGARPVGKLFARIEAELDLVYIGAMWVAPALRGAGIGRRLVHAAEGWGKDRGATRSELWVTEANRSAVRFYETLGYRPTHDTQMLREGSRLIVRKLAKSI